MIKTISKEVTTKETHQSDNKITWEEFQEKYLTREDEYKYEWVDGEVITTKRAMDKSRFHILINLQELLDTIKSVLPKKWYLVSEGDTFFDNQHRRPDIAFYTKEQIIKAKLGENIIPQFLIEVISTTDQINRVNDKLVNYRNANVKVIWQIYPKQKEVHIVRGKTIEIKTDNDICSAEEVIKGFKIKASEIFK